MIRSPSAGINITSSSGARGSPRIDSRARFVTILSRPRERRVSEWLFTSDLHGQSALYEQLVAIAAAHRPSAVVLGGDLCPHAGGADGVERQRLFLEGFLVEFARRLRES